MAALAICAITAALVKDRTDTQAPPPVRPDQPPPAEPGMIPLTIPEIKRLLAALTTRPLPRWLVIHWDAWTRRHQARARWFHKRTRLARDAEIYPGQLAKCGCHIRPDNQTNSRGRLAERTSVPMDSEVLVGPAAFMLLTAFTYGFSCLLHSLAYKREAGLVTRDTRDIQ